MGFLFQALDQLRLGLIGSKSGDLFKPADMFFLVLFEFCAFLVNDFDLAVQVFLDGFVFLDLLVEVFQFGS